jgi:Uri superfamily endonuclease
MTQSSGRYLQIPTERGTYILIAHVRAMKRIDIGRLGPFDVVPGYYAYVGSAFGEGGLRARIEHHVDSIAAPHWHIDYLLQFATLIEVWFTACQTKLEQDWAELLSENLRAPIRRFGSSDYRRSRTTHLFYSKRRPKFEWFSRLLADAFQPDVRAERAQFGFPEAEL